MLYNKDWDRPHTNPVSEVLLAAADLLEQRGHAKWTRVDEKGSMCLLGALSVARGKLIGRVYGIGIGDTELTIRAAQAIIKTLGFTSTSRDPRGTAAAWNNAPERTGQEVIDAMRLAARVTVEENA